MKPSEPTSIGYETVLTLKVRKHFSFPHPLHEVTAEADGIVVAARASLEALGACIDALSPGAVHEVESAVVIDMGKAGAIRRVHNPQPDCKTLHGDEDDSYTRKERIVA